MKKKWLACFTAVAMSAALLAGCGSGYDSMKDSSFGAADSDYGNSYIPMDPIAPDGSDEGGTTSQPDGGTQKPDDSFNEQGSESAEAVSYLSLDRNTAAYARTRSQIYANRAINATSVRLEELYNYFDYDYPAPEAGEGVRASAYLSDCPWNAENKLLTVGLKTEERKLKKARNNYVFLVDVSGSMSALTFTDAGKKSCLDLAKYGILTLVEGLGSRDSVSVVTYASGIQTVLEPTFASEEGKKEIISAVKGLVASGATNGSGGLELAYENAQKYYSEEGNNRVVLLSDGDFNAGITNVSELKKLIADKAKSGVYLSVLGLGMSNKEDTLMESLAMNGNGNYAFIDTEREARKIFCEELSGTLVTVLKDAKASVTFNPANVSSYRMLGYDTKTISQEEFDDPRKDTGEVGSNLCVSVVYEITLTEGAEENGDLAEVLVRFKSAETGENREVREVAFNELSESKDVAFIACVSEVGLILRNSQYRGTASLQSARERLEALADYLQTDDYKQEFYELVKLLQEQGRYGD